MTTVVILGEKFMANPQMVRTIGQTNKNYVIAQENFEILQNGTQVLLEVVADPHPEYCEHPIVTPMGAIHLEQSIDNGLPVIVHGFEPVQLDIIVKKKETDNLNKKFTCVLTALGKDYFAECILTSSEATIVEKNYILFRITEWLNEKREPVCLYFDQHTKFWTKVLLEFRIT